MDALHVTVPQDEVPGQDPLLLGLVGTHWTRELWWDVALVLYVTVQVSPVLVPLATQPTNVLLFLT